MNFPSRLLLSAGLVIALAACNTNTVRPLTGKDVATYVPAENPQNGYIIGSFAVHGDNPSKLAKMFGSGTFEYTSYDFYFDQTNATEGVDPISGAVEFASRPMLGGKGDSDYEVEDGRGHVLVVPLTAGEYEFNRWRIYSNNGQMESSWFSREPYSIPFTVKPGEALYIGELRVAHTFGKNVFNMIIPTGGLYTCNDEFERDMPLIKEDYPFIEGVTVDHQPICDALAQVYVDMIEAAAAEQ